MSDSPSLTPQKGSVRSIISIFENTGNGETSHVVRRTKSMSSIVRRPQVQIRRTNDDSGHIVQQIRHLEKNVSTYHNYSRENHIFYQNQIIFILTDIAISSADAESKSELTEMVKRLNKNLNSKLPHGGPINLKENKQKTQVVSKKETVEVVNQRVREETEEDQVEETPISVKSLKQLFEKNSTKSESTRDFGKSPKNIQISTEFKYVTFNDRQTFEKRVSFNDEELEAQIKANGQLSPDSLSEASEESEGEENEVD